MRKDLISVIFVCLLLIIGYLRFKNTKYEHKYSHFKLDTIVEVVFESKEKNEDVLADSLFSLIDELDLIFSYYNPKSELFKINSCEQDSAKISDKLKNIILYSKKFYEETNGSYDVTIGALTDCWQFDKKIIPDNKLLEKSKKDVGFDKISFKNGYLYRKSGIKINLGSLAKGFIIDEVVDFLIEHKALNGVVNIGGDLRIFGNKTDNYNIGIRHPRKHDEIISELIIKNGAVVTSGDYERFFIKNGERYCHIIDAKSGFPCNQIVSVTILAKSALLADVISTACFTMSSRQVINFLDNYQDVEGIVYYIEDDKLLSEMTEKFSEIIK